MSVHNVGKSVGEYGQLVRVLRFYIVDKALHCHDVVEYSLYVALFVGMRHHRL